MGIAPYGSEYETEDDRREHNRPIPYYAFNEEGEQVYDYDYGDDDEDEPTESTQWPDDVDEPPVAREPNRYVVAIYELGRHYGGPEEGGWWYNTGELRRLLKIFRNEEAAFKYARRCNHWLERVAKAGGYQSNLSSMGYTGGCYSASVHGDTAPKDWSDYQPYE